MYAQVPHQGGLFHKLRNLWQVIRPPSNLSRDDAQAVKRKLLQQARSVFYASTPDEATQRRAACCAQWQADLPEGVATLCRDWPESIAFFRILTRFPQWPCHFLRTTSLLQRVKRMTRPLFRAASAFHSPSALVPAAARVLNPLRLICFSTPIDTQPRWPADARISSDG